MGEAGPRSEFVRQLSARGMVRDCTDLGEVDALASRGELHAYAGYDLTAPSLHVGNLATLMVLAWLQRTGAGRPVVLLGGGTTLVGDPSGKREDRPLMAEGDVGENRASLSRAFGAVLDLEPGALPAAWADRGAHRAPPAPDGFAAGVEDNAGWLSALGHLEFLRDVGRHFRMGAMLARDSVSARLAGEGGMSYLEFSYSLLQAYDFVELGRRRGVVLQVGGSDQWGNIVSGVELGRRTGAPRLHGLTCPLLTTADGRKMGKTERGAVWLDPRMLHPNDYWQSWRDVDDASVGDMLQRMTFLPLDEVARLGALRGAEANEAKVALADAATEVVHGRPAAVAARAAAGGAAGDMRTVRLAGRGCGVLDAFVAAGLATGTGHARRMVADGGMRVDGERVTDVGARVGEEAGARGVVLSVGKRAVRVVTSGPAS